jgi:hypothetical protein
MASTNADLVFADAAPASSSSFSLPASDADHELLMRTEAGDLPVFRT